MKKTVKDAYGEILRLRNEFYQKWQEADQYDENRGAYKAKYEAFDKALELLTPSIMDPQLEDPDKLTHSKVTKTSDQEESTKKCMYSKDNFTDEDRKGLCEGCGEDCEYSRKEESESEELEVAFNRFLDEVEGVPRMWHSEEQMEWAMDIARHFAIWQKQQIMKDAVDAFIYKGGIRLKEWPLPEKCGKHLNPVKVIIIKEDKV